MSMRYTSGSAGRFSFDHANRMAGAVDLAETAVRGHLRQRPRISLRPIVATLVESFENVVLGRLIWDWVQVVPTPVGPPQTATQWRMLAPTDPDRPSNYGAAPSGFAIQISGNAAPGQIVELTPISGSDGRIWFTFSTQYFDTVVLKLGTSEKSPTGRVFNCTPVFWSPSANSWLNHPILNPGYAENLCGLIADPPGDTYGQVYEFPDLGTLDTMGEMLLDSLVIGQLRTIKPNGEHWYVFAERHNLRPFCAE